MLGIFLIVLISMIVLIVFVFIFAKMKLSSRTPKLEVSLLDIRLKPPIDYLWEYELAQKNLLQLEVDFEISNRYQGDIRLFGVYSKRLNSLALEVRDINFICPEMLVGEITKKFTIYYLIKDKDKDIITKINPERDFRAYASFKLIVIPDNVENSWRGNFVVAPFFGIGFSKVIDARNK